ncbi:hypothetical protein ACOJBM_00160 [Rhizobium beringeri]
MIALKHNRSLPEVHAILTSGRIPMVDTVIRKSNHFSDVGAGFGSLYSKLSSIENNPSLTPSAKRRASESVLDAIDLVKKINNEFIELLRRRLPEHDVEGKGRLPATFSPLPDREKIRRGTWRRMRPPTCRPASTSTSSCRRILLRRKS